MKPVENWNCSSTGEKQPLPVQFQRSKALPVCHEQQHLCQSQRLYRPALCSFCWDFRAFYNSTKHESILHCFLKHCILFSYGFSEI